jgi:hypothetical protein
MNIYIDQAFIEKLALKIDHPLFEKLRVFLRKPQTGKKFINFDSVESYKKAAANNPLFEELLEYGTLTFIPDFQKKMREKSFYDSNCPALFFNEESDNEELQTDFGCIFIGSTSLTKAHFLFNWHLIPFTKPRPMYNNWSFMAQLRHPCNALVVTDNYLFAKGTIEENKKQLNENILPILFHMMPPKLKIDFHLTIIGSPIDRLGNNKAYIKESLQELHKYIVASLKEKFNYAVHLSILIAPFHDRNILTNYAWLNSGNSFTYFTDGELHSNTNLMFQPVTLLNSTYNPFYYTNERSEENCSVSEVWKKIQSNCRKYRNMTPDETKAYKYLSAPCVNRLLTRLPPPI